MNRLHRGGLKQRVKVLRLFVSSHDQSHRTFEPFKVATNQRMVNIVNRGIGSRTDA